MSQLHQKSALSWLWVTMLFLVVDQLTKQYVVSSMELHQSINVLPFFNITYAQNPGAAFSFLADQPGWQRWFFTVIAVIASTIFFIWLKKTPAKQRLLAIALACMLSGALGNLVDRVIYGYVIDFLDFYLGQYHWPTFNIADSIIFIGASLMIIDSFKSQQSDPVSNELEEK